VLLGERIGNVVDVMDERTAHLQSHKRRFHTHARWMVWLRVECTCM